MYFWGLPQSSGNIGADATNPNPSGTAVADVRAGSEYSIIILEDGTAQSAGVVNSMENYMGHLGVRGGDVEVGNNPFQNIEFIYDAESDLIVDDTPVFVKAFAGADSVLSQGKMHSLLVDNSGRAWTTGSNDKGQLCLGDFRQRNIPQQIPINGKIIDAAIGSQHSLLLLDDGSVYGCGSNEVGQLGLGIDITTSANAIQIEGLGVVNRLSAGHSFSLFQSMDSLYATGSNFYGQLCSTTPEENVMTPISIVDVDVSAVSSFEAIKTSSFILFSDGSVGVCGRNNVGQLGDGSNEDKVRGLMQGEGMDDVTALGVGPSANSVFLIKDNGEIYATGLNDKGQLGVGDNENKNLPTLVGFGEDARVTQISASGDHTLAR